MIPRWINKKDGSILLNDVIRYVKSGFTSPGIPPGQATPTIVIPAAIAAGIPSVAPSIVVEAGADEVAELFSLMGVHGAAVNADVQARMSVQITDVAYRRRLMNRDVLVNHVFGTNLTPTFLRESTLLESQQTMLFDFTNNSILGATSYQFAIEKRKFQSVALSRTDVTGYIQDMRRRKMFLTPYWLTSDQAVIVNPLAQRDVFFTVTNDMYAILFADIATMIIPAGSGGDVVEGFTVELFDAKTERPLQNQPIARSCCSGNAGFPFILPTGWIIEPNTRIHARFTSLVTVNPIEIFWTFVGVSAFVGMNTLKYPEVEVSVNTGGQVGA